MARKIVLGHGDFGKQSEMILVPPDTTITFFSDPVSSQLLLPAKSTLPSGQKPEGGWTEGVNCSFDYEKVVGILDKFVEAETPRKAGDVLLNMRLSKAGAETVRVAQELADAGKWGGEILLTPPSADQWYLCTGNSRTCPTPMLNVAKSRYEKLQGMGAEAMEKFSNWADTGGRGSPPEGLADFAIPELTDAPELYLYYVVDGVPDDHWHHDCNGILGKTVGEGYDLIWLACTGFKVDVKDLVTLGLRDVPAEMKAATVGPDPREWVPSTADITRFNKLNDQKIKDTPGDGTIRIRAGGALVLVGNDHEANAENYIGKQTDLSDGKLTVKKAGAFSKSSLQVDGISQDKQEAVRQTLAEISDKEVAFS